MDKLREKTDQKLQKIERKIQENPRKTLLTLLTLTILTATTTALLTLPQADNIIQKKNLSKDLVLHYNFDSGNTEKVIDRSGNNRTGIIHGDPKYVETGEGMAMKFDGKDDYIELSKNVDLDSQNMTIFWRLSKGSNSGQLVSKTRRGISGHVTLEGDKVWVESFTNNLWSHEFKLVDHAEKDYALVFSNRTYLYGGGARLDSGSINLDERQFRIGYVGVKGAENYGGFFKGEIRELKIYNRSIDRRGIKILSRKYLFNSIGLTNLFYVFLALSIGGVISWYRVGSYDE